MWDSVLTIESMKTSSITSVIFGCLIIIAGVILIYKKKKWAWGVVALGIISVVSNGITLYRISKGTYEIPGILRWAENLDGNADSLANSIENNIENGIERILNPELIMFGNIVSIFFGVLLIVAGVILRKKSWSWILILLGVVNILIQIMQIIWW